MNTREYAELKKKKMRECPEFWDTTKSSDYVVEAMAKRHMLVCSHNLVNVERRAEGVSFRLKGGKCRPKRDVFREEAWRFRRPRFSKLQVSTMRLLRTWGRPQGIDAHLETLPKRFQPCLG